LTAFGLAAPGVPLRSAFPAPPEQRGSTKRSLVAFFRPPGESTSTHRCALGSDPACFSGAPNENGAEGEKQRYLNSVTITAFLGADAETRPTRNNSNLTVFSVATKNSWKDSETGEWMSHTEWHHCVVFGRLATATASLKKGDHVHLQGQLQTREYERTNGPNDTTKHRVTEIRVSSVFRVERLASDEGEPSAPQDEAAG